MKTFTEADVMAAVEAAVAANPNGVNPMDDDTSMCLNRSIDPDATTPRCIASQVHFDLTGRELDGGNGFSIMDSLNATYGYGTLAVNPFTSAVALLSAVQSDFDRYSQRGLPWSEALAYFKGHPESQA